MQWEFERVEEAGIRTRCRVVGGPTGGQTQFAGNTAWHVQRGGMENAVRMTCERPLAQDVLDAEMRDGPFGAGHMADAQVVHGLDPESGAPVSRSEALKTGDLKGSLPDSIPRGASLDLAARAQLGAELFGGQPFDQFATDMHGPARAGQSDRARDLEAAGGAAIPQALGVREEDAGEMLVADIRAFRDLAVEPRANGLELLGGRRKAFLARRLTRGLTEEGIEVLVHDDDSIGLTMNAIAMSIQRR